MEVGIYKMPDGSMREGPPRFIESWKVPYAELCERIGVAEEVAGGSVFLRDNEEFLDLRFEFGPPDGEADEGA